ncbi:cation:proton antiporter [uncultured Odoribacter sp.]|uniref:cation:proton antiporter n=1 Tax=uncultured Odoribacter sp. TaxID=876416 RepID=UPI00260211A8|nr:cation:proton antiporter [uncultured Odoribacter sp.]
MSHLPTLITDLALILVSAGIVTLIFKKLRQPLVLGYIVAGFIAGPHVSFTPTVIDTANIQTWADIGVVFLLFALGLDFSFKKLMKVGGPAIIAAITIITGMVILGMLVGSVMGWKRMDCIFLGGMLAMSSTSIIYKALEDMGLRTQRFAGLVLGILVIEDLVAVVLMVLLSTMAVKNNFEGAEMVFSIAKLFFFLMLWFIIGIFIIPTFFKRTKLLMNEETMLIVALGLCFLMVVAATQVGFSSALGAFVMGSILAETMEAEKIGHLVKPVKDLFAAIFFVSVGMMVDPGMIWEYMGPIILITLTVLTGQSLLGTLGVVLAGQPLKVAMQCGFCLSQIGEFAFIIASLGLSLGVTDSFLYPIVVAVSVITTFLTPYMMRLSEPAYPFVEKRLPVKWKKLLDRYTSGAEVVNQENNWKKLLVALTRIVVVYSVILIAELILAFSLLLPFIRTHIPGIWGNILAAILIVTCMAPFLRAIVAKKNHSVEFQILWQDNRFNRGYLVSLIVFRFVLAMLFVMFVISALFKISVGLLIGIAGMAVAGMIYSRYLKKQSILIERRFLRNLNIRDISARPKGKTMPRFAGNLLSRDLHMADFIVPADSKWAGNSLSELGLKTRFGIQVVAIFRGNYCLNIPGGRERIFPQDRIQVIGSDEQLLKFGGQLEQQLLQGEDCDLSQSEVNLRQFIVDADSAFLGKTIGESGIRERYKCLIVGMERGDGSLHDPTATTRFEEGDLVWIVGEDANIYKLIHAE